MFPPVPFKMKRFSLHIFFFFKWLGARKPVTACPAVDRGVPPVKGGVPEIWQPACTWGCCAGVWKAAQPANKERVITPLWLRLPTLVYQVTGRFAKRAWFESRHPHMRISFIIMVFSYLLKR